MGKSKKQEDFAAQAYELAHGVPLSKEKRERARQWARKALADAAAHAEETAEEREELRRKMGWTE